MMYTLLMYLLIQVRLALAPIPTAVLHSTPDHCPNANILSIGLLSLNSLYFFSAPDKINSIQEVCSLIRT
jgi:hypothetical protein